MSQGTYVVKLPRVKPKVLGIPISRKTVKDLNQAAKDVFMRRFTPEDVKVIRMDICRTCDRWDERFNRCKECGCQMKVKVNLTSSECPLGKWGRHISDIRA